MKCKKIRIKDDNNSEKVLLGILLKSTDKSFIKFKTSKREYLFSKEKILAIEDTETEFKGGDDGTY